MSRKLNFIIIHDNQYNFVFGDKTDVAWTAGREDLRNWTNCRRLFAQVSSLRIESFAHHSALTTFIADSIQAVASPSRSFSDTEN